MFYGAELYQTCLITIQLNLIQLYIIEAKIAAEGKTDRSLATLHAINRAIITSPEPIPNIEFTFSDSDIVDSTHVPHIIWVLTRTEDEPEKWVMPDPRYWSFPSGLVGSYEQIRKEIATTEIDFADKKKQVVWRGALKTNKEGKKLIQATRGKNWADVAGIDWQNSIDEETALPMVEHCQYQFVLQIDGIAIFLQILPYLKKARLYIY
jgi:hypothetical protein